MACSPFRLNGKLLFEQGKIPQLFLKSLLTPDFDKRQYTTPREEFGKKLSPGVSAYWLSGFYEG